MKKSALAVATCLTALALSSKAHATPVPLTLTLDPSSVVSLTVDALGSITATVNLALSGTQDVTLFDGEPITGTMSFDGGAIALADQSLLLDLGPLGAVRAGFIGASLDGLLSTGVVPLNYQAATSFDYTLDPGDQSIGGNVTSAGINSGIFTYSGTGTAGMLLGSGTLDFSTDPVNFDLPPLGQVATLTQTLLGSSGGTSTYQVVLSAPLSISESILTDPIGVAATLKGQIVATGFYTLVVPEPSTVVLALMGGAALVPLARRRFRRAG